MSHDSFSAATGGRSSNGRTPDSGSGYPGSNPGLPAKSFQQLSLTLLPHGNNWQKKLTSSRPHPYHQSLDRKALGPNWKLGWNLLTAVARQNSAVAYVNEKIGD